MSRFHTYPEAISLRDLRRMVLDSIGITSSFFGVRVRASASTMACVLFCVFKLYMLD